MLKFSSGRAGLCNSKPLQEGMLSLWDSTDTDAQEKKMQEQTPDWITKPAHRGIAMHCTTS